MKTTTEERFWAKVDKTGECWLWTASTGNRGYGYFRDGAAYKAHRFSFELANGPIPLGLEVDHMCHVTACVNPAHLRLATRKQNQENLSGNRSNSTSGVRGVTWKKSHQKWEAQLSHNSRKVFVGLFSSLTEAEAAVTAKRLELFTHNDQDRKAS